jgi:SRSO17 transposase
MSEFACKPWFEEVFWPTYPRDLCNRPGSKSKAMASAIKRVKDSETAGVVIDGLREQMRYYRKLKKSGKHDSEWKMGMAVTWLNGEHWTDEIPSHYELQKTLEPQKCACGEPTAIRQLCLSCYEKIAVDDDWRTKLCREYFIKNGLGRKPDELRDDWFLRLRTFAKQKAELIGHE